MSCSHLSSCLELKSPSALESELRASFSAPTNVRRSTLGRCNGSGAVELEGETCTWLGGDAARQEQGGDGRGRWMARMVRSDVIDPIRMCRAGR